MKRVALQPWFQLPRQPEAPGSQPKCDIELVDRAVSPYPPSWLRARHNRRWLRQEFVNMPQRVQTDKHCFRAASPQSCSLASLRPGVDDAAWGHASPASGSESTLRSVNDATFGGRIRLRFILPSVRKPISPPTLVLLRRGVAATILNEGRNRPMSRWPVCSAKLPQLSFQFAQIAERIIAVCDPSVNPFPRSACGQSGTAKRLR
ncbi:hypothetical protein F5144DRAFT_321591 [Chaetomium tenue]|uniref:Uncharacterized protein n=1 Tax=Chaetomium tenue TaxID=1854479 RepID=A0ACB7P4P0_9PEZI|nr:hypothetical protein F5144DRAFT_321591 [Chaetomium globosum]